MRVLAFLGNAVRWLFTLIWGSLGILAIIGYFTQVGAGLRERGLKSFVGNAAGLFAVFIAPISLVTLAARKPQ